MIKLIQRLTGPRGAVEFCDACSQVCTPQCRSQAHHERVRARALYDVAFFH